MMARLMTAPLDAFTTDQDPARAARAAGLSIVLLSLAVVACWVPLYRWYSIDEHYDVPYFAFEKVPGQFDSPTLRWTLVLFVALALLYAAGYVVLRRASRVSPVAKTAIVGQVLAVGGINAALFPVGALDVFRYMVALKIYYYRGGNPFLLGYMDHQDDPFSKHAFLLHLPNAKGPVWVLVSAIPSYLAGFDDAIRFLVTLKAFNLPLIGLTAWLIWRYLGGGRSGWIGAYLFVANPLVLFEGVGNGHNDVHVALFLVGAVVALAGRFPPLSGQAWLALPLVTASALVKYFTVQVWPLLLLAMVVRRWRMRTIALALVGSLAVTVAAVAPFWDGGEMLDGIERVNAAYEGSAHVGVITLVEQYRRDGPRDRADPHRPLFAAFFAVLALPIFWGALRGRVVAGMLDLYLLFVALLTLLYPWYLIPAVALLALRRRALPLGYLFLATGLGLAYYPIGVWARFDSGWPIFERHLFMSLFLTVPMLGFLALALGGWVARSLGDRRRAIWPAAQPAK